MIRVKIFKNPQGKICGFDADDHGDSIVCAAVSILTLNAVNSIESFTNEKFTCDFNDNGGYLSFRLLDSESEIVHNEADLLLNSMLLGLEGIQQENPKHLKVIYEEVQ